MTADVIESFYRTGVAAHDDQAFAGDLPQEVIPRLWNDVRAPRTDPIFKKESVDLPAKKLQIGVIIGR